MIILLYIDNIYYDPTYRYPVWNYVRIPHYIILFMRVILLLRNRYYTINTTYLGLLFYKYKNLRRRLVCIDSIILVLLSVLKESIKSPHSHYFTPIPHVGLQCVVSNLCRNIVQIWIFILNDFTKRLFIKKTNRLHTNMAINYKTY